MSPLTGRVLPWALVAALAAVTIVALLQWFDAGISLDHARQQQRADREQAEVLRTLLRQCTRTLTRADVIALVHESFSGREIVKERENRIEVGDVFIKFNGDRVADVTFLSEDED